MNILIDKNISQSQLSNFHRDEHSNETNNSLFYRVAEWLHLIKRWKDQSIPEVCKHVYLIVEFRAVRKTYTSSSILYKHT
jgi:hypothetical protein